VWGEIHSKSAAGFNFNMSGSFDLVSKMPVPNFASRHSFKSFINWELVQKMCRGVSINLIYFFSKLMDAKMSQGVF
jgi:hypothetical protein